MKILALSPHTDDCEIGCGGSLYKHYALGHEIRHIAFSMAVKSIPPGFTKDATRKEVFEASRVIGATDVQIHDFPVRDFPAYRQEILELMTAINKEFGPDIVFLPSTFDTHQDHQVITQEGFRAFKYSTILGYEIPWNNLQFSTQAFVVLYKDQIDKKIKAVDTYESQKIRLFGGSDFIRTLATFRGNQIHTDYAEAFEVIRWIVR